MFSHFLVRSVKGANSPLTVGSDQDLCSRKLNVVKWFSYVTPENKSAGLDSNATQNNTQQNKRHTTSNTWSSSLLTIIDTIIDTIINTWIVHQQSYGSWC